MCLYIKKEVNICVKKCFKKLRYTYSLPRYYFTPYQDAAVPSNGWLTPVSKSRRKTFKKEDRIEGGFIHAYQDSFNYSVFKAYAIQVKALGERGDLVCRLMYIPDADTTKNKEATIKFLERRPNVEAIAKRFPHLRKYLDLQPLSVGK